MTEQMEITPREIKFRIFFDGELIEWNQYGKEFYLAPTAGAPCIVFYRDKSQEPHFISEGRLNAIMQYTGLKDKNGKEIYEGDYIHCTKYLGGNFVDHSHEFGYVDFLDGAFGVHRSQGYYRPFRDWFDGWEFEIIGNIFSDPSLLKQLDTSNQPKKQ